MINRLNTDPMTTPAPISTQFSADKRGYKSYLKSIGAEYKEGEVNAFVVSFSGFKRMINNTPTNRVDRLYDDLEKVNARWGELLEMGADDDGDGMGESKSDNDAWSCKMNARRIVKLIEEIES